MNPHDLVYRQFDVINHERIINGVRFDLYKIIKAKQKFENMSWRAKRLKIKPPENLVFNLKTATITIQ